MKILNILCSLVLMFSLAALGTYNYHRYTTMSDEGPVIMMDSDTIEVSVKDDPSVLLEGVMAYDKEDGDVTSTLGISSISEFVDQDCTVRKINYVAFDEDAHVAKASRKLVYTDYTTIHFSLDAPLRFPMQSTNVNLLSILHARDCIDGDISKQISFSEDSVIEVDTASDYNVVLQASNSAGEIKELPVTIRIYDNTKEIGLPQIELTDYMVYTKVGEKIDPRNYIASVYYGGEEYLVTYGQGTFGIDTYDYTREEKMEFARLTPTVSIDRFYFDDGVDYNTPGVYEIKYMIETLSGEKGTAYQVVIVE